MKLTLTLLLVIALVGSLGLLLPLCADEAEDAPSDAASTDHQQRQTIQLLEAQVRRRDALADALLDVVRAQGKAIEAARNSVGLELLRQRLTQLAASLQAERERGGVSEETLGQQLMAEQQRHTADVTQLYIELAKVNELAERNRIAATKALKQVAMVEDRLQTAEHRLAEAAWLFGEIGPAARSALPWLTKLAADSDDERAAAIREAISRIQPK